MTAELRVVWLLAIRSVRQALRRPQMLAPVLLLPSVFLVANTGAAGRAPSLPGFPPVPAFLDFELPGIILLASTLAAVPGGSALALDVERGFLDRFFAAPMPRAIAVTGRLAGIGLVGALAALAFLIVGLVFGTQVQSGPLGAVVVVVLAGLTAAAFGGLGAAIAIGTGQASYVTGSFPLVFLLLFFSSAFFPTELLREPAAAIATGNPLTWIVDGLRSPILNSSIQLDTTAAALGGVGILGLIGVGSAYLALQRRLEASR